MNNKNKWFYLLEGVLAVFVVILAYIIFRGQNGKELGKISVIIQDSDDNQWSAFRYGLKMAAQDMGAEMFVVSTGDILTPEEQIAIINGEIENGADAVIVQPAAELYEKNLLDQMNRKIPVMLVQDSVRKEKKPSVLPVIGPDNYAMGKALAEELLADYNNHLEGKALGIVAEIEGTEEVTNRKRGFEDAIKDAGARVNWTVFGSFGEEEENSLEGQTKVDIVVALDDKSLTAAGKCSSMNDLHGAVVYGIGNSTGAVYYLDTGIVECLIVPDEFNVGYQSLTEVAERLGSYFYKMKNKTVSFRGIRREELFSPKNQEILFAISQ